MGLMSKEDDVELNCWLNDERVCASDCVAYSHTTKLSTCKVLVGIDRIVSALRPNDRPVPAVPPKVT
jgi:hypothetical protein